MRRSTQIYLALTLLGVILIGMGSGISVFEISSYKTANYAATIVDPNLPPLETTVETLEVTLKGNDPFQLNTNGWFYDTDFDVEIDNTLDNQVKIEVTQPKGLYHLYLSHEEKNRYTLYGESQELNMFKLILHAAKDGYLINHLPELHIKLIMNESQAAKFTLNAERNRTEAMKANYRDEINSMRESYQEQIAELQEQRTNEVDALRENYENQINELRENYETQLENLRTTNEEQLREKENQMEQVQQQLEDVRSSLH